MVHALAEIRRTLKSHGVLIDMRPLEDRWPVEVSSGEGYAELGRLTDLPLAITDDQAATAAMRRVVVRLSPVVVRLARQLSERGPQAPFFSWR